MSAINPSLESDAPESSEPPEASDRVPMRVTAARGTAINAAFEVALQGLGFVKGFIVAAFLAQSDYGVWGVLVISIGTLGWLKQVGISEKFVQQDEHDQTLAFQRAFTLEAISNLALTALVLVALPLFAVIYGQTKILLPGLVLTLTIPAQSLRAPTWIFYRDLNYAKQRALDACDPLASFFVTVALAAAGFGYWSLVIGYAVGVAAAATVAVIATPYPIRVRYDKATMRTYWAFSWPLFIANASGLVIPQVSMLAGEAKLGLAGAGVINLAGSIAVYTDKVDQIITWTLYPAICRVKDRAELLFEAFVKTNRLTLMWGVPFGVGVALFAPDLISFGIGERWRSGEHLIQAFGLIAALNHIGFNWTAFFRARGHSIPMAIVAPIVMAAFLVAAVPGLVLWGLDGFAAGLAIMTIVSVAARTHFLRQIFPQFRLLRHAGRAVLPVVPATAATLAVRALSFDRSLGVAVAEATLFIALTAVFTWLFERRLLAEAFGYLRGKTAVVPVTN
jgi:lipopolysaccharide exporter